MKELIILVLLLPFNFLGQSGWTWQELPEMPVSISNNAVCEGFIGDTACVYSFAGIDSTKIYSGINLTSLRYNTVTQEWSIIPDLPDTLGKIGVAASYVNEKIYIIGGYHVFANNNEISSNKVHVYDPVSNSYLADAAPIPVPIDDQVQAVWRDSLIFVVTGWSNNGNVNNVQIFNPYTNEWQAGTSTPNNNLYRAFGASGVIIGDTIFYNGGATGGQFNSTGRLRKGVINPDNPTEITWDQLGDNPGDEGYRMAAVSVDDKAFWIGGSGITYNYNGIAYNGSGGVSPLNRILRYNSNQGSWFEGLGAPYGVMDLRGAARVGPSTFVICGGMEENQKVSNKAYQLSFDPLNSIEENQSQDVLLFPNPGNKEVTLTYSAPQSSLGVFQTDGKLLIQIDMRNRREIKLDTRSLNTGIYLLKTTSAKGKTETKKLIIER